MTDFWVGIPGDLTPEQSEVLKCEGFDQVGQFRLGFSGGSEGIQWTVRETYVKAEGEDETEAKQRIASVLSVETSRLSAHAMGALPGAA